nr:hypothetical protein [Cohnella mopanensis]
MSLGNHSVSWGKALEIDDLIGNQVKDSVTRSQSIEGWDWDLPDGVYRAKEIVRELGTLLAAVKVQLGESTDMEALLANIQATLAISGRETSLPIGSLIVEDKARAELARQAHNIGVTLTTWAREFDSEELALKRYGKEILGSLLFRSRCDHHLWTHEVTNMLTGPAGSPAVMQLFNEYLHQIVLLRDTYLPFDNWQEIPIELRDRSTKGLRDREQSHSAFISEFMLRPISHKLLVRYAQSVLGVELPSVGYGFQYRLGTILPASLASPLVESPIYLLHWYPVWTAVDESGEAPWPIAFDYAYPDYYSASRSQAGAGIPYSHQEKEPKLRTINEAQFHVAGKEEDKVHLDYRFRINTVDYAVDLGQALRGHRFKYRPLTNANIATENAVEKHSEIISHQAEEIVGLPNLVTHVSGIHLIRTGGNELLRWALLGKLYPENVIVLERGDTEEIVASKHAGKGFGAKFLIH